MSFIIPSVIFVPCCDSSSHAVCGSSQEELSSNFYSASRWSSEGKAASTGLSPPKLPPRSHDICHTSTRSINKIDSSPRLPQRSARSFLTTPPPNPTAQTILSVLPVATPHSLSSIRHRRVRSLPVPHARVTVASSSERPTLRSIAIVPQPRLTASRIVERTHQQTQRPGPLRNVIMARAA